MMDPHREMFLETATVIDGIDREIEDANERKKEIYADVKDEVSPEDFKALKEAIKLRRKRRVDKDGCERHDERVWAILNVLEATEQPRTRETPPRATVVAANGIVDEAAPTRAHPHVAHEPELPPHDPETGELIEFPECMEASTNGKPSSGAVPQDRAPHAGIGSETLADREATQREGGEAQVFPPSHELPDIPACLDRRQLTAARG
jgi:uncharacterized protein (UPF0335 family)